MLKRTNFGLKYDHGNLNLVGFRNWINLMVLNILHWTK